MKDMGSVSSINISSGGVPKLPVSSVKVSREGLEGDSQNFHGHGGLKRAVSLYSCELIEGLKKEGNPIFPGSTGENLTLEGVNWDLFQSGLKLSIGSSILELTMPAVPCKTISASFSNDFNRISEKKFPGWSRWYASVIKEGTIQAGDLVYILDD
ncbi:MAG: MOSC domain-containing protein [Methanobacteriota archaeon]|nr:MAG: MOSC domain-containing protein [Euryarchaeota archaeon]|tara:strand:+ start:3392 stop:3856 length:465 start_codon:yes stop_codon:yes gene_type:complete